MSVEQNIPEGMNVLGIDHTDKGSLQALIGVADRLEVQPEDIVEFAGAAKLEAQAALLEWIQTRPDFAALMSTIGLDPTEASDVGMFLLTLDRLELSKE